MKKFIYLIIISIFPSPALAYIGPGMGIGAISVAFGIFAAVILFIFGIVYYPIKRFFKKRADPKINQKNEFA